jgi:serine/threonine-protein kinase
VTVWAPAPEESGLFATHRRPAAAQNGPAAPPPAAPPEVSVDTPPGQSSLATPVPRLRPAKQIIPLTDASIAHAGRVLAQFLGPIALVLSRRAAQDAHDERSYLELLAAHLPDPDERSQFLREVRQRRS